MSENRKNRKALKSGSYSIGVCAVVTAIVIVLNVLVSQLPATWVKPDTTGEGVYSIGEDTENIVKSIDSDVTVYLIARSGNEDSYILEFLKRYEALSSKISVKTVDPTARPNFVSQYTDKTLSENSVIVVGDKRSTAVDGSEFYKYEPVGYEGTYITADEYSYYAQMYQQSGQTFSAKRYFFGENEITGALDYVTRDELSKLYALTGHGEAELSENYKQQITDENTELVSLTLTAGDEIKVPDDAGAVLINVPSTDITADEKEALKTYVKEGGHVILTTYFEYYSAEKMPNLSAFCSFMGLKAVEDMVVEGDTNKYYYYPYCILPTITGSGLTSLLDSTAYNVFAMQSHAIEEIGNNDDIEAYALLNTSSSAYLYSDEEKKSSVKTYSLAYESYMNDGEGQVLGSLVWYASPYMFDDNFYGTGNTNIFAVTLQRVFDKETAVSIIGKKLQSDLLTSADNMPVGIYFVALKIVVPLAALIIGFAVWFSRRRR